MVEARIGILALAVALSAGACANAASGGNGGDTDSGIKPPGPDANPNAPDADPNAPDADPNAPDANPQSTADASSSCPKSPCDLYAQCGCQTGWACDLDSANLATGGTECRAVSTAGQDTATCSANEGCDSGYTCLGSPGQCRRYCDNDTACASNGPGSLCLIQITYNNGTNVPGATTCTKNCDPTSTAQPTGCPTGMACHVYVDDPDGTFGNGDERFLTDCTNKPSTGGTDGATCTYNSDCAAGYDCIALTDSGGNTTNQCKQTCVYGSGTCITGTCNRYSAPRPTIGGTEYGVCI